MKFFFGKYLKFPLKLLFILIGGSFIGLLLLVLVYCMPTDRITDRAKSSVDVFSEEGAYPTIINGYKGAMLDEYTDAWMIRIAFYNGTQSPLDKALHDYYYGYDNDYNNDIHNVCESMIAYLDGKPGYRLFDYSYYWHGYLLILKPMMMFLNYSDIRVLLLSAELMLVICLCILLDRRGLAVFIPAFAASLVCIQFFQIGMCMQYSWVFIVGMIASVLILKKYDGVRTLKNWAVLFLITGMITCYVDFLTYPLYTLGIPLTFLVLCTLHENGITFSSLFKTSFVSCVCWAVGYAGMWFQKWIIYSILTGENLIAKGLERINYRSGHERDTDISCTYPGTVSKNIGVLHTHVYVIVILLVFVYIAAILIKNKNAYFRPEYIAIHLLICALPFAWYFISQNHSTVHEFMAYRILSIAIFSGLCMITELIYPKQNIVS